MPFASRCGRREGQLGPQQHWLRNQAQHLQYLSTTQHQKQLAQLVDEQKRRQRQVARSDQVPVTLRYHESGGEGTAAVTQQPALQLQPLLLPLALGAQWQQQSPWALQHTLLTQGCSAMPLLQQLQLMRLARCPAPEAAAA